MPHPAPEPRSAAATLAPGTVFEVAGWEVTPRSLVLRRDGEERRLEPRVMSLLVCLAEHAGEAVTREELLARVWGDVVVGDDAVQGAVAKLRRALALAGADGASVVATVPKVGYRLAAPARWRSRTPSARADEAPPDAAPGVRRPSRIGLVVAIGAAMAASLVAVVVAVSRRGDEGTPLPARPPSRPTVRPVTSWEGLEVAPAFAPGPAADRVAFAAKAGDGGDWDLWVQVLGDGDPLQLTAGPGDDVDPAWSPDGRHVAFLRHANGGCTVLQVPALGGAERALGDCAGGEGLTWSPDGERLLWAARSAPDAPFRIVELRLADLARRAVTEPAPGSLGDLQPVVSPDGATLAFLRSPVLGVEDVHLQPLAGGPARRLTRDALKVHGVDWMPDGRSLVVSSNRGGLFSLWRVDVAGGAPRWLGVTGGDLDAPAVGGDGRRVAFEQWESDADLYRVPLRPGAVAAPVLGSTRWDFAPDVSPDGARVVFVSDRDGSAELWSAPAAGGVARRLTDFGGPYVDHPRWSPDGRRIAFDARPGGEADVYVLDEGAPAPRRLTSDPARDLVPSWSPDGRWVHFASDRGGAWEVWRVAADGGEAERVTTGGGYAAEASPDGRWLYVSRHDEPGIWRQALEPGAPAERVVTDLAPIDRTHWRLAPGALLYLRRPRHDRPVLTRHDLATGATEDLADLGPIPHNSGLALDPTTHHVLFTRLVRHTSDILVLELAGE